MRCRSRCGRRSSTRSTSMPTRPQRSRVIDLREMQITGRESVMKLEGGCYCGELRYVADGEPMMKAQCHCRECQYITGGSPNVFIAMPIAGFSYTKGTPKKFTRSDLKSPATREFCANCGTHVVT